MLAMRLIACCLIARFGCGAAEKPVSKDTPDVAEQRLQWFREAKFGMFIHWGLYSELGGEWRGRQMPARGELQYIDSNVELIMEGLASARQRSVQTPSNEDRGTIGLPVRQMAFGKRHFRGTGREACPTF